MVASIRQLTTTVNNLAQSVATLTGATGSITGHTRPINIVEKPKAFEGKTSEGARLFRSSFTVWVQDHESAFAKRDEYGSIVTDDEGKTVYSGRKMISSALSFMTGNAAIWARPHLERIAEGKDVFTVSNEHGRVIRTHDWAEFLRLFKAKFEPQDAVVEAKSVLFNMKQGNRTFSDYLADFETWAPRTGWSDKDLFDRLKGGLSTKYIERLYGYSDRAQTYDLLVQQCRNTDLLLMDLNNALKGNPMSHTSNTRSTSTPSGFVDPNAMEIDASYMDKHFVGVTDFKAAQAIWNRLLKGRCKGCGSKQHSDSKVHADHVCHHCGKTGHYASMCLARLTGQTRKNVSATLPAPIPVAFTSSIVEVPDQPPATVSATTTTTAPKRPAPDTAQSLALLVDMVSTLTKRVNHVEQSLN